MIVTLTDLIKNGSNDELRRLISETPSLANENTEQGISLLQFAAYCRNTIAVEILRNYKTSLDIFEASSIGEIETIKIKLIEAPALINSYSVDGFTPLGLACFFGHVSVVKFLLGNGADPDLASNNPYRVSPLHSACAISNYEIARLLIINGANVNAKQMQGVTPLHSAAHHGQTELVRLLIDNGADVNAKMENGQTPLAMTCEKDFGETGEVIRLHGGV